MTFNNCKDCAYLEFHENEKNDGYSGFYCGAYEWLTDKARIENQEECEWSDENEK